MSTLTEAQSKVVSRAMRILGKVRSEKKTAAVRENAKKGGWPKGRKRKPMTAKNAVLTVIAFWLIGAGTLIWQGEKAARRGAAQVPSIEIIP